MRRKLPITAQNNQCAPTSRYTATAQGTEIIALPNSVIPCTWVAVAAARGKPTYRASIAARAASPAARPNGNTAISE